MKPIQSRLTLAAVLVLAACVSTKALRIDESLTLAPICPAGVRLFTDSTKVGQPYQVVALLTSTGDDDRGAMTRSQKKKAAELGANGVILGTVQTGSSGVVIGAYIGMEARGEAIAIYIPADSVRVRTACHAPA